MSTQTEVLVSTQASASSSRNRFTFHRNSTFISLLVGYAGYYLCRQNLGVAFEPMKASLGIDAIQFGWISSIGTFTYALGKVGVGSLADSKLGGKFIFYLGLFSSALFCLLFGFGKGMTFFLVAWSINRLFQSMGWSGLINVMSRWVPKSSYGTATGLMSISYQFGGVLVTLYAGFLLSIGGSWQTLFFIPALTLAAIGLITYPFLIQSPEDVGLSLDDPTQDAQIEATQAQKSPSLSSSSDSEDRYLSRFAALLTNKPFLIMLGLSSILTFLRECFSVWMPAYFTSMGESASIAAFKSTVFPFLGCLGTLSGGWISDRYLSGRRSPVMACLIGVTVLCLLGLGNLELVSTFAQSQFGAWFTPSKVAIILVGATGFFLLGSYSFVGGVVALDFGGKKSSGTAAGLLDGVGYLGATLAGVGFANLMVHEGWNFTFMVMAGFATVSIVLCLLLWNLNPYTTTKSDF